MAELDRAIKGGNTRQDAKKILHRKRDLSGTFNPAPFMGMTPDRIVIKQYIGAHRRKIGFWRKLYNRVTTFIKGLIRKYL